MDKRLNIIKKMIVLVSTIIFIFLSIWKSNYNSSITVFIAIIGGLFGFSIVYLIFKIPKMNFKEIEQIILVAIFVLFSVGGGTLFGYTSIYALISAIMGIVIGLLIVKIIKKFRNEK